MPDDPWKRQEGGNHYQGWKIQPAEFLDANDEKIGYLESNAIKYLCRFPFKGAPRLDLLKAIHYIELILKKYPEEGNAPHA